MNSVMPVDYFRLGEQIPPKTQTIKAHSRYK